MARAGMTPGHTEEGVRLREPLPLPNISRTRSGPQGHREKGQALYQADLCFLFFPACVGHKNASLINWGCSSLVRGEQAGRAPDLTLRTEARR